jgi:transposase
MTRRPRRNHTPAFKAKVALAAIKGDRTLAQLAERHPIKPTSPRCHSAWQPNPGRGSTYRRGKTVQTTETTLEVGELSRAIGLVTSRTKSMKVRTTGLTVRFFNVMIVT